MDAINTGNLIYVILDFGRPNSMTYPIATNVPIRPVLYLSQMLKSLVEMVRKIIHILWNRKFHFLFLCFLANKNFKVSQYKHRI